MQIYDDRTLFLWCRCPKRHIIIGGSISPLWWHRDDDDIVATIKDDTMVNVLQIIFFCLAVTMYENVSFL